MPSIESNRLLAAAVAACEDKKAEDITILALDPSESGLSDYFLICNGTNDRQNVAITDEIEIRLKREFGVYPNSVEGRRQGEWILMDYVDFIVHVFSPEKRAFYGLERLRKTATTLSIAEFNADLKARINASRARKTPAVVAKPIAATPAKKAAKKIAPSKKPSAVATKPAKKTAKKVVADKKSTPKNPVKKSASKAPVKAPAAKKRPAKRSTKAATPKKSAPKKKAGKNKSRK